MIKIEDDILREEFAKISPIDRETWKMTDAIAARIDEVMKRKGISKVQLARLTQQRPSVVTKWLGGSHNFTCRTLVLISKALGVDLIRVTGRKKY